MKKVCFREQKEKLKDRIGRQRNKKGSCLKKIIRKSLTFPARCSFLQILTVFSNGVIIYRHKKSFAPGQKKAGIGSVQERNLRKKSRNLRKANGAYVRKK